MKARFLSLLAVLTAVSGAGAKPLTITLPAETAKLVESPLPGYTLAQAMCLTCHSAEYMKTQPVSSRTYWQGSVTKMQKTFGAPIPDDMVPALVDYLVKTYGNERTAAGASAPAKAVAAPAK